MPTGEKLVKHGMSGTRIYRVYRSMISRVMFPSSGNYSRYGGRGIQVCSEWLDKDTGFINFYNWAMENGYTDELSIDRKDVNGDYKPDNCRWITFKKQQNNRTNNRFVTFNGETKTLTEWAEALGISGSSLAERLEHWGISEALTTGSLRPDGGNSKQISYNNKTQSIKDWSEELGINYNTLAGRLRKGWSVSKAFSTPIEKKFSTSKRKKGT